MSYEYLIANRYLQKKKRTIIVIVVGVACISIILSIMNGFESVVLDRFLAFDSHVIVTKKGENPLPEMSQITESLDNIPHIIGYSPFISTKAILMSENDQHITTLKGVDLETVDAVSQFRGKVFYGTNDFTIDADVEEFGIILGIETADKLAVTVGDMVWVMSLRGLGRVFQEPPARRFTITGIFDAGLSEYNVLYSFISLPAAQKFLRMGNDISGYDINASHIDRSSQIARTIQDKVSENVLVKTWYDLHKNLFASMNLEKWAALIVLSLMILVASFGIASSLIMLVLEKRHEIGILKSMGSTMQEIKKIFIINGMIIGASGTVFGLLVGLGLCLLQSRYGIIELPSEVYIINTLPVQINTFDFILVGIISLFLTFLATVYPARLAAKLIPTQALRYE